MTPLLPQPSTSFKGVFHSMCSWQSANFSRVTALPEPGVQTNSPSFTIHLDALPSFEHQLLLMEPGVPSKRMIASDGMPPAGTVIFTGSGRFTSWTAQACVASGRSPEGSAHAPTAASASKVTRICFMVDSLFIG